MTVDFTWSETDNLLLLIKEEFCRLYETPDKNRTPFQMERLVLLKKMAISLGYDRYELLKEERINE